MNVSCTLPTALRAAAACALVAIAAASLAQTGNRSVQAVPQPRPAPVSSLPSPTGLASPLPNPAGLTSQFPAGLPSPIPGSPGEPPAAAGPPPPIPAPAVGRAANPPVDAGIVPQTSVLGASGYGGAVGFGVPAGRASPGVGSGPYTALQIAQSFIGADANRDGELTRAEARRLTIMPYSFEEMDRNHDGILTRFEYEDGVR